MKISKTVKKWILFVVMTGLCLIGVMTLYSMEPVNKVALKEITPLKPVTVTQVRSGAYPSSVKVFGEASPKWTTTLRAQVEGKITYINNNLQPGRKLHTNETILEIDKTVYIATLAQAQLELENANVNYLKAMRRADQAKSDWKSSGFKKEPVSALVFHGPQLKAAIALVTSAKKTVDRARQDLDNTCVKSPYAGLVIERFADKGEAVFPGDTILTIVSWEELEIKVNLDGAQVKSIGKWRESLVTIKDSATGMEWPGKIIRDGGILNQQTRLRSFYIIPLKGKENILPGMFVSALIRGQKRENLLALPESALTRDGYVWYADKEDRLRSMRADVAFYNTGRVFIENSANLNPMSVVVTPLQTYISGIKVIPLQEGEI